MKKITLLFTAVLLSLNLAACNTDAGASAYKTYQDVVAKMDSVKAYEAKTEGTITIKSKDAEIPMPMEGVVKQVNSDNGILMEINSSVMGQMTTAFYTDGYLYASAVGQKAKMPMPLEDLKSSSNSGYLNFNEAAIKVSKIEDGSNGDKNISFTLDGKAMNDVASKFIEKFTQALGQSVSVTLSDLDYACTIDKDSMIKSYNVKFVATLSSEGEEITLTYDTNVSYTVSDDITINLPDDLDQYQEVSA